MEYPVFGKVYTLYRMYHHLQLPDEPFLLFNYQCNDCVVQTSTIDMKDLLEKKTFETLIRSDKKYIEKLAESRWRFERITREDIPLFRHTGNLDDIDELFDIEIWPKGERSCGASFEQPEYKVTLKKVV